MASGSLVEKAEKTGGFWSAKNRFRIAFLSGFASLGCWMPLLNVWLEDSGMKGSSIGFIAAIPWIVMLLVQPLWGMLADRVGKKRCFGFTLIMASLLFFLFPVLVSGKMSIVLMTLLFSIFQTPVLPLLDGLTLDHVANHQNVSYSHLRFWGAPGFALGAFLTGLFITTHGINMTFYFSGGFLFLTFLISCTFPKDPQSVSADDIRFSGLRSTLSNKYLIGFLCLIMIVSIAQSASSFFLTVYMKEIGASPSLTGTAIGVQGLSELPFYFIAAWLLRKTSAINIIFISIFGTVLRLFLYFINGNPYCVIGIETLNGVTWTLLWVASVESVNKNVAPAWRATGQSLLWAMYFGAGAVLGNIITGGLYEKMPMRQVFGIISLMILGIGLLSLFIFFRAHRRGAFSPRMAS